MLTLMLGLIAAYFGTNVFLTAICFAIRFLLDWREAGSFSGAVWCMWDGAVLRGFCCAIGMLAAMPLLAAICVAWFLALCAKLLETFEYFARCECSV